MARSENSSLTSVISVASARFSIDPKLIPARLIFVPVPLLISELNLIPPRLIVPVCLMSDVKFASPTLIVTPSAVFTSVWKATSPTAIGAVCSTRAPRSAPPRLIFVPVPLLISAPNLIPPKLIVAVCLISDLKFTLPMSRVAAAA